MLVAPLWRGATWFPQLLEAAAAPPVLLPEWPDLLLNENNDPHPLTASGQLRLAAWLISGQRTRLQTFRGQCPRFSWHLGGEVQAHTTTVLGDCGVAGVRRGRSIRLARL